jgi:RimJ/RimL family protein N-acetyltransferase
MKWNNNLAPYKIITSHLVIKCWEPIYATQLRDLIEKSSNTLLPWMPFAKPPFPTVNEEINIIRKFRAHFDLDKDFVFGVFDKNEEVVIGSSGLHTRQGEEILEIGYWIGEEYQNNGFATEIASNLITLAFDYSDVKKVEVNAAVDNHKSINVISKLEIKKEGIIRCGTIDANGINHDLEKWSILREEYSKSKHKVNRIIVFDSMNREIK